MVDYHPYDPFDPATKDLLITLRNIFPDDEPDTFEFIMHYLSSALDGYTKESMMLMLVGDGANGKTFMLELLKATLGDTYAVKMPSKFLSSGQKDSESASPALVSMINARLAYYSETKENDYLQSEKIKEITGADTISARHLYGSQINFKLICHQLVLSNHDLNIRGTDHGIWRRLLYVPMKIKFVEEGVPLNGPNERRANSTAARDWPSDPRILRAFLSILVHYYESLQRNYGGKVKNVPRPTITRETEIFRNRQDTLNLFITERLVRTIDGNVILSISRLSEQYATWYEANTGDRAFMRQLGRQLESSCISKLIDKSGNCAIIRGYRLLAQGEQPGEGEVLFSKLLGKRQSEEPCERIVETAQQMYERKCREYRGCAADAEWQNVDAGQLAL